MPDIELSQGAIGEAMQMSQGLRNIEEIFCGAGGAGKAEAPMELEDLLSRLALAFGISLLFGSERGGQRR